MPRPHIGRDPQPEEVGRVEADQGAALTPHTHLVHGAAFCWSPAPSAPDRPLINPGPVALLQRPAQSYPARAATVARACGLLASPPAAGRRLLSLPAPWQSSRQ